MTRIAQQAIEMTTASHMWLEIERAQNYYFNESKKNYRLKVYVNKLRQRSLFIWFISLVQIIVFIIELGRNWSLTGSPIQIKPTFNLVIGPSVFVLINMGARFSPCMHAIPGITDNSLYYFPCLNYTGLAEQNLCTLSDLCGFTLSSPPNQWYRFILPIFLHAGVVHIGLNLLTQLIVGASMEIKNGTLRVVIVYFASGIFGMVIEGNFAPNGFATVGCSGSLFGIVALYLLNILYDWHSGSCCELVTLVIDIVINFGLGLLPSIGNFNHIGGFIMGLLLGVALLAQPTRCRSIKWWIWCIARFICLTIATAIFVLSIQNIYSRKVQCTWCKYLDCLPINKWCDIGYLKTNIMMTSTLSTLLNTYDV